MNTNETPLGGEFFSTVKEIQRKLVSQIFFCFPQHANAFGDDYLLCSIISLYHLLFSVGGSVINVMALVDLPCEITKFYVDKVKAKLEK